MFWKNLFKTPVTVQKTKASLALVDLRKINLFDCNRLYSSDYAIIEIQSISPNITKYNSLLENIIYKFENNYYLTQHELPLGSNKVSFNKFLLSPEGNYLDLDITFIRFINNCIRFLIIFDSIEKDDEKSSENIRNLRLTSFVVDNILQLSEELRNV